MTASPLIIPVARFFSISGGAALAGGKVYTYAAGTDTPKATYTDFSGDTENTNPVILDSSGQADIWLNGNYKINLLDANDVQQPNYPVDNVSSYATGSISEYAVTTGSANNYILTPSPAITEYTAGQGFNIKINVTNTGPSTINVSNLGAKDIVRPAASALVGGELVADSVYRIVYDGTNFQIEGLLYNPTGGLSTLASAVSGTTDLGSVSTHLVAITGTNAITSFGTSATLSNPLYFIRFTGILTLTHNGTSLIIPGAANITTANGDTAIVEYLGSGNWKVHEYTRLTAFPLVTVPIASGGTGQVTALAGFDALKQAATDAYAGVSEYASDAEFQTGTATDRSVTPANVLNSLGFADQYVSAQQTITAAGLLTLAHGLGREPEIIQLQLECLTAEHNYSIGDKIKVNFGALNGANGVNASVRFDTTNIYIRFGNTNPTFSYPNNTTGAGNDLTNANWALVVKAWG